MFWEFDCTLSRHEVTFSCMFQRFSLVSESVVSSSLRVELCFQRRTGQPIFLSWLILRICPIKYTTPLHVKIKTSTSNTQSDHHSIKVVLKKLFYQTLSPVDQHFFWANCAVLIYVWQPLHFQRNVFRSTNQNTVNCFLIKQPFFDKDAVY